MFHDVTTSAILLSDDGPPNDLHSELILGLVSLSHSLPFPHSALFQGGESGVMITVGYIQRPLYHLVSGWVWSARAQAGKGRKKREAISLPPFVPQVTKAQTSAS